MVTLSRMDWDAMKRPVYPKIQFTSDKNMLLIQCMVKLYGEDGLYIAHVKISEINEVGDIWDMLETYNNEARDIARVDYKPSEDNPNLFKVEDKE